MSSTPSVVEARREGDRASASSPGARAAAWWGLTGVVLVLVDAAYRLGHIALEAVRGGLTPAQWAALAASLAAFGYGEGWRAFHRGFAHRAAARAAHLARGGSPAYRLRAPLFCMALVGATRRRLAINWGVVGFVVAVVLVLRRVPQPYRGIVDAGVALALSMGVVSTLWHARREARALTPGIALDLP